MKLRPVLKMNKRGGLTDVFLFIIITFTMLFISGVMIFIATTTNDKLHEALDNNPAVNKNVNASLVIEQTFGEVPNAYTVMYWSSLVIIVGMVISIFIGNFLVQTKPVFIIPYFFIVVIAIIVSVPMSNTYEQIISTPELASAFSGFIGANFIMFFLPIWVTMIGFIGAIILFTNMGQTNEFATFG